MLRWKKPQKPEIVTLSHCNIVGVTVVKQYEKQLFKLGGSPAFFVLDCYLNDAGNCYNRTTSHDDGGKKMKPVKQQPSNQSVLPTKSSPAQIDPNRLIRLKEVLKIVPVAASTWWNWVATSRAPAPIRLGNRCTCWRYSDVVALTAVEEG